MPIATVCRVERPGIRGSSNLAALACFRARASSLSTLCFGFGGGVGGRGGSSSYENSFSSKVIWSWPLGSFSARIEASDASSSISSGTAVVGKCLTSSINEAQTGAAAFCILNANLR